MFQLSQQDIHIAANADNKLDAIKQVASALTTKGCVDAGYVDGMLQREQQTSTYLGNGIAIPHGTIDTRHLVKKTGIQVFQFPKGIDWGDGQLAYVVIGIAASSDEHLSLLRQLTHVLSDESVTDKLAKTTSADELRSLLMAENKSEELLFNNSMIALDVKANNLTVLQAVNLGNLQQADAISADFISDIIAKPPLNLGQGIWFSDSAHGNQKSAIAISRTSESFSVNSEKATLMITVSMVDTQPQPILDNLMNLLNAQKAEQLLNAADQSAVLALLSGQTAPSDSDSEQGDTLTAEFTIRNEHGIHARPGAMLVNTIKKFDSNITVANLDGTGNTVNGRSLMKVVALGVKKGHKLRFTASGPDAQEALNAIGEAIENGLGEGAA